MSMKNSIMNKKIVVIGAGAAGMLAAAVAAENGADVTVLEKNARPGRKLNITGKGRCNVTNDCDVDGLLRNMTKNARFMYSSFSAFSPQDMMRLLETLGVQVKTERGARVFPCSDKASDVTDALVTYMRRGGVRIKTCEADGIVMTDDAVSGVRTVHGQVISCDAVILATGGISYPLTGSTGDGYRMARECGHTVTPLDGSLVPLVADPELCRKAQGLTLKNVTLTAYDERGKEVFSELGEMMFTHFGVTGPLVLSASAHMREFGKRKYYISIDLKPGLTHEKLEERLLRDMEEKKNKDITNLLRGLLPASIIPMILHKADVSGNVKVNSLTREMRGRLRNTLKALRFDVSGKRPVAEAVVTSGGISTSEINPKTMESKIVHGLYFAGEIIDVDAYTGGFNLQIAWSSAYAAGRYAAL